MSAVGNYEVVKKTVSSTVGQPGEYTQDFVVSAPAGKKVLSGGYEYLAGSISKVMSSRPSMDGTSWVFKALRPDYGSYSLDLYVACAEMG